ncbi:hypothetical protein V6N11_053900 [Hibiscus sabdariffa]|uniref:Uncharacterized protein n=1 Tax=Hibiscus sabdariffa TaxID=183260 RepID=A0ABR2S2B4_9ROSI
MPWLTLTDAEGFHSPHATAKNDCKREKDIDNWCIGPALKSSSGNDICIPAINKQVVPCLRQCMCTQQACLINSLTSSLQPVQAAIACFGTNSQVVLQVSGGGRLVLPGSQSGSTSASSLEAVPGMKVHNRRILCCKQRLHGLQKGVDLIAANWYGITQMINAVKKVSKASFRV